MAALFLTSDIRTESDVVYVRRIAKKLAALLAFDDHEQARIATAVSEIVRNAFLYADGGRVEFRIEGSNPEQLLIRISDRGRGITDLASILADSSKSETDTGVGIPGARRLMDSFRVQTAPGRGTTIELGKSLPPCAPEVTPELALRIVEEMVGAAPANLMAEIRQQNIDLLLAFEDGATRRVEPDRSYREEAETSREMTSVGMRPEAMAPTTSRDAGSKRAEEAAPTQDEILASASHDLRSPLSVIVNYAYVLEQTTSEGAEGEHVRACARAILHSTDRMVLLIADLCVPRPPTLAIPPSEFSS